MHAACSGNMFMQHGHAAWICSVETWKARVHWTCTVDMHHEHVPETWIAVQCGHAAWTCSMETWTWSKGM
jgi:hypothetical protein